jgi:hypothetical protein
VVSWLNAFLTGRVVAAIWLVAGQRGDLPRQLRGRLFDVNGQVVGMPTLNVYNPQQGRAAPGIGYAILSNAIRRVADQLIARNRG